MESKLYCDFCDFKNTYYFRAWCLVRSKAVFNNHWFGNCWKGRFKFIFSNRVCFKYEFHDQPMYDPAFVK